MYKRQGIAILYIGAGMGMPLWAWIGVIPIMTGSLGWCPMYIPFGINTNKAQ